MSGDGADQRGGDGQTSGSAAAFGQQAAQGWNEHTPTSGDGTDQRRGDAQTSGSATTFGHQAAQGWDGHTARSGGGAFEQGAQGWDAPAADEQQGAWSWDGTAESAGGTAFDQQGVPGRDGRTAKSDGGAFEQRAQGWNEPAADEQQSPWSWDGTAEAAAGAAFGQQAAPGRDEAGPGEGDVQPLAAQGWDQGGCEAQAGVGVEQEHGAEQPDRTAQPERPEQPVRAAAQPQVRRTRRERVEATAATLAGEGATQRGQEQDDPPPRQRVSLQAPVRKRAAAEDGEEVRVYAAPLLDGLGKFDLGSVPASVTPPKTWRKAAWFATGASGAVVVGLLFAGTFLVGGPTTTTDALGGGWPGRQNGGNPLILPDPSLGRHGNVDGSRSDTPGTRPSRDAADSSSGDPDTHPQNAMGTPPTDAPTSTDPSSEGSSDPVTTGPTSTPPSAPEKPPVTPAERETSSPNVFYTPANDPNKMGDNSEKFFNNVTTDPQEAASVTGGDLKAEGPQRLRQRYADVAYFEVKKVQIDPDSNTTVNTLEVTHNDGSKTVEERTLTFGDDEKITDDGS